MEEDEQLYSEKQRRVSTFMKTPRELEKVNPFVCDKKDLCKRKSGSFPIYSCLATLTNPNPNMYSQSQNTFRNSYMGKQVMCSV